MGNFYTNPKHYKLKIQTTNLHYRLLISLLIFTGTKAFTQNINKDFDPILYNVGYQNIITTDSGRIYKPCVSKSDKFYYRPVEIDIWYPAINTENKLPVRYGEFLNLLEQRSNRFQNDTIYKSLTTELVQYISINLNIRDTTKLISLKTSSYLNAAAIQKRFPLILYMSAYNGMSYENLKLFEWLAAHGYIVACITSVGRYPGNMSTKSADLLEQVYDGYFSMNLLKTRVEVDSTKIAVIGYSWGGLAALILAMKTADIKAILSLDGSEMHYYGESVDEDKNFDELKNSAFFEMHNIKVPYAYFESGFKQNDRDVDSIFNTLLLTKKKELYIHFPKATHEDFSCIPSLEFEKTNLNDSSTVIHKQVNQLTLGYFNKYLKNQEKLLSQQISAIYLQHIGDSVYPEVNQNKKTAFIINGRIVDKEKNEALSYVNIGIPNKNTGTVSQRDGSFRVNINQGQMSDSLKFSMAGYLNQVIPISDLINRNKPNVIFLKESFSELKEVVIIKRVSRIKTIGNTTTSKFVSIGLPLKFLGTEIGVKLKLGKNPVILKSFSFNISDNRLDTAVFRMNIYNLKNGLPFDNIIQKNVIVSVGNQKGLYKVNLLPYKLEMKGDIILSLEWIEGLYSGS
ncbi:MAG TPA: carboxypeptidase-like regulatory domain-containing protein, partial [Nitrosopumilaceae archaeon]|nr:carboxypeptidase-like regulatory domain-containing protein [Nitrosopumilaceae archaeon]